jgi:hypothetical protein
LQGRILLLVLAAAGRLQLLWGRLALVVGSVNWLLLLRWRLQALQQAATLPQLQLWEHRQLLQQQLQRTEAALLQAAVSKIRCSRLPG